MWFFLGDAAKGKMTSQHIFVALSQAFKYSSKSEMTKYIVWYYARHTALTNSIATEH